MKVKCRQSHEPVSPRVKLLCLVAIKSLEHSKALLKQLEDEMLAAQKEKQLQ